MGKGLNGWGKRWPVAVAALAMGAAAYWQWGLKPDMSPVVSYGGPGSVEFRPAEVQEDEDIFLCFKGIVWHRVTCPSKLTTYLTPVVGDRLDLPTYAIGVPPKAGPVEPGKWKCRPWKTPKIGDRSPQMTFSGFAESMCGKQSDPTRIITDMPSAKITINKKGQ